MRHALLACYTEFADILKQLAITHVSCIHYMSVKEGFCGCDLLN